MLYTYDEIQNAVGSKSAIRQRVQSGDLFHVARGIYSDNQNVSELSIISKLYPNAIFTLNSAFYYYGLTDTIPQFYYLATDKDATKIRDSRIVQVFENSKGLSLGRTSIKYNNDEIIIYNKERLLIELIRNKNKLPFDYYKEIINNYREILYSLDIRSIQDYISMLPKEKMIMKVLQLEVF